MGRQATNSGRISLDVDAALKMRATIAAIKAGMTLTQLVERGLVLALNELRAKAKDEDRA
jgi:predicted HicB family RNase H-like nuclease